MPLLTVSKRILGQSLGEAAYVALKTKAEPCALVTGLDPSIVELMEQKCGWGASAVNACGLTKKASKYLAGSLLLARHWQALGDDHKKHNCGKMDNCATAWEGILKEAILVRMGPPRGSNRGSEQPMAFA